MSKYVKVVLIFESLIKNGVMTPEILEETVLDSLEWVKPEPDLVDIKVLDSEEIENE